MGYKGNMREASKRKQRRNISQKGLDYEFDFGKHKGFTMEHVIEYYPTYVKFCIDELNFNLDDNAWKMYEKELEEYYRQEADEMSESGIFVESDFY